MKKFLSLLLALVMVVGLAQAAEIVVVSREEGSGTRGAFVELTGVEEKNAEGKKVDNTVETAEIVNATAAVITSVEGNENSVGYISLGSLGDTVKALKIDGVEATPENITNGSYKLYRPFNLVVKGAVEDLDPLAQDFIKYILSAEGQKVAEENGYIAVGEKPEYAAQKGLKGKITVGGSSSVTPLMEKLKEAYIAVNPDVEIEVQLSDSTTGVTSALDGIFTLGMASRALKDSEVEKGATAVVIANDGLAVIVNKAAATDNIKMEEIKGIYVGEITDWDQIGK